MTDAGTELAKLQEQRSRAASRVSDLERDWRAAVEASRTASATLTEVERNGGSATTRHKAEEALADAQQRASEPWAERVEGAKAAARDVDRRYRTHIAAHLGDLVGALEADGRLAAERVNGAAADLIAAHAEWDRVAAQIASTIVVVARPGPLDVSRSRAEEAAKAAIALLNLGGEEGPVLDRSRPPWVHLLADDEVADVVDVVESVPA